MMDNYRILILCGLFLILYAFVTIEARTLQEVGEKLFSEGRRPVRLSSVWGGKLLVIIMFFLAIVIFIALAWLIDNIAAFSAVVSGVYILGGIRTIIIRKNALKYFKMFPPFKDNYEQFILARREVFEEYLRKPHATEMFIMAAACIAISFVAFLPRFGIAIPSGLPYLLLTAAMFVHEYFFVWNWRLARNRKLAKIEKRAKAALLKHDPQASE